MSITTFLRQLTRLSAFEADIAILERLAGQRIKGLRFWWSLDETRAAINPTTPIFLLPIADHYEKIIGLHLSPANVSAGKLPVAELSEEGWFIEVAHSISDYVYSHLRYLEGLLHEDEQDVAAGMSEELSVARNVFGADFYPVDPDADFTSNDVYQMMIDRTGGAAGDFRYRAARARTPEQKIELLRQDIVAAPDSMVLHCALTEAYIQQGDAAAACQQFLQSLERYHYTAHRVDLPS